MKRCAIALAFVVAVIVGMYFQVAIEDFRADHAAYAMDAAVSEQE